MGKLITAIVLAAGKSSRMDEYKLTKILCNKPIISYVFDTLKKCDLYEVIVVYECDEVRKIAESYGFKTIQNTESHLGQSTSIVVGTENARACDGFIYMIADQPFIKEKTIKSMIKIFNKEPDFFVAAAVKGKRCSPVIFPYKYKEDLLSLTGDTGGRPILKDNYDKINLCECTQIEAFDIDTVSDFDEARDYLNSKLKGGLDMNEEKKTLRPSVQIRIETDEKVFGSGHVMLMEKIKETGSLNSACTELGMSYSKAWKIITYASKELGFSLIDGKIGGKGGGGSKITAEGEAFLEKYKSFCKDVKIEVDRLFKKHFG